MQRERDAVLLSQWRRFERHDTSYHTTVLDFYRNSLTLGSETRAAIDVVLGLLPTERYLHSFTDWLFHPGDTSVVPKVALGV